MEMLRVRRLKREGWECMLSFVTLKLRLTSEKGSSWLEFPCGSVQTTESRTTTGLMRHLFTWASDLKRHF